MTPARPESESAGESPAPVEARPDEARAALPRRVHLPEQGWSIELAGEHGTQWQDFYLAEGACTGRIAGRMRGANHPGRRTDGTFGPDFQGVIETADGAEIFFDWRGYGRAYPPGRRQIVVSGTHLSQDSRYRWLNDVVCVGAGDVRARPDRDSPDLVIDVAELIWEPPAETG